MSTVRIVRGNAFELLIPLTLRTWEGGKHIDVDFFPVADVSVVLTRAQGLKSWKYDAEVGGNIATIHDEGKLPVGTYHIEVHTTDEEEKPLRFKQNSVLHIVDTTAEAGIDAGVEFSTRSRQLDGVVLLGSGGTGGLTEEVDPVFTASPAAGITSSDIDYWDGKYDKPSTGIPKNDFASDVQTSLGKADTSIQGISVNGTPQSPTDGVVNLNISGGGSIEQVQADWSETDTTDPAYIKNKPTIPDVSGLATKSEIPANTSDLINDSGFVTGNDLADVATSGSYDDLSDKPTIPAAQVNADWNAVSGVAQVLNKPTIPTAVSDLENDEGYVTAEDVAGVVAATGDVVIVESNDYIDIFIYGAEVNITPSMLALYAAQKSATIKVSGSHLKGDIAISVPSGFTASPSTIAHVNGVVAETDVTITYTGADASTASGDITATAGDATKTIPVAYTQYSGPTIIADDTAISFKAGGGATQQQTLTVQGVNLEAGITAAISGTDAAKFSVNPASISQSGGTASGTLTITYSPAAADSGTHTATLTLSSSGATSKTITLNGAVSEITTSVDSLTMTAQKNSSATETFTVEGSNLAGNLSIVANGTGLSVDTQTIQATDGAVAETTVTVTFAPTATGSVSGSITISDGNTSKNISVAATATGVQVKYNDNTDEDTYIEWEAGQIDATTGVDYMPSDTTKLRCRTKDYLPCAQSVAFDRNYGNAGVVFYDENKVYKGYHWFGSSSGTTDVPNGAVYFRAYINNANLADVAKQYTTGGPWLTDSRRTSGWGKGGIYTTYEP